MAYMKICTIRYARKNRPRINSESSLTSIRLMARLMSTSTAYLANSGSQFCLLSYTTFLLTMKFTVELTTRATIWLSRCMPPVRRIISSTMTASITNARIDEAANLKMQA